MVPLNHPLPVLGSSCSWTLLAASYVFTPITLDLLMPLNESRKRYFSYLTMFSHDRTEYVDIVYMNILVVYTIGLLCVAGTEQIFAVFAHYMCGMFEITRYEWKCKLFPFSLCHCVQYIPYITYNVRMFMIVRSTHDVQNIHTMTFKQGTSFAADH